jgi:hypothetical protein
MRAGCESGLLESMPIGGGVPSRGVDGITQHGCLSRPLHTVTSLRPLQHGRVHVMTCMAHCRRAHQGRCLVHLTSGHWQSRVDVGSHRPLTAGVSGKGSWAR